VAALALVPLASRAGRHRLAFAASAAAIALMVAVAALSMYPVLVPSSLGPELSLTAYNAASSPGTITTILAVAAAGLPFVVGYTTVVYRVFRGPVRPHHHGQDHGYGEGPAHDQAGEASPDDQRAA
jgi:cytochrome d ubiquinol oxidase subunit II